ncbi:MAG: YchJ family protein [Armatimonadetes bacterium]|nr:YchJ family protein [Armatimonadota bacterium]
MSCPCGNSAPIEACCGRFISGDALPETAEELMRSRYTAYATQNIDYVVESHDPDTSDRVDRKFAESWSKEAKWESLEVVDTEAGGPEDEEGVVEFIARYTIEGARTQHHERSNFRKAEGRWYYTDGEMVKPKPIVRESPKVGRNEPCPCGSGKKYKKCCGVAA